MGHKNIRKDLSARISKLFTIIFQYTRQGNLTPRQIKETGDAVKQLSAGLTAERTLAGNSYMDQKKLLDAYLYYFYPVSYAQALYALQHISCKKGGAALDIGSGPGPISMLLGNLGFSHIKAIDYSSKALHTLTGLCQKAGIETGTEQINLETEVIKEKVRYDCITVGHCINELWKNEKDRDQLRADFIMHLAEFLTEEGKIVMIEPGANYINHELLRIRGLLLARGLQIEYPCICEEQECPALLNENSFCHSEYLWERPPVVREIAKFAGIKKEILNMTLFIFSKKKKPHAEQHYRIVSDRMLSKSGRYRYIICGYNGRLSLSIKKDDTVLPFYDQFTTLKRGDLIEIDHYEQRENGIALTKTSSFKIIDQIR